MKSFEYTITDPVGLHARPAGLLVKEAKKYTDTILIHKGEKSAEAKKLMALMALCILKDEIITVTVEGENEEATASELEAFFKANL